MNRRIISFLLCLTFIISLCSCKLQKDNSKKLFSIIEESFPLTENSTIETSSFENEKNKNKENKSSNSSTDSNKEDNPKAENAESDSLPILTDNIDVSVEKAIIPEDKIEEPEIQTFVDSISLNNTHSSVSEESYYQYSLLASTEKVLYERIVDTIIKSKSIVDIKDLSMSETQIVNTFKKVLADYPQFFYISRVCLAAYTANSKRISSVILLYTDGNITDSYNEKTKIIKTADRSLINKKIKLIKSKVESIISGIPEKENDVIKEKIIYDYVIKNVNYNYSVAENIGNYKNNLPNAFDIYGAIIDGSAVCEGYAKMFQYLCYCVGINSTQVTGSADGGNHMWNAVIIDNKWYHTDTTWDDANDTISYNYFNLTTKDISIDHSINSSETSIPDCNSKENSFDNIFAITIKNFDESPKNYETAIQNTIKTNDKSLYVYFEDQNKQMPYYYDYFSNYFFNDESIFCKYLNKNNINVSTTAYHVGKYYILLLI